ncbi:MAG: hypothetical protein ACYS8X_14250, partial [Planctomycetota bacterium]
MAFSYSPETVKQLISEFERTGVARPMRVGRYEPGAVLDYAITGVAPARRGTMRVEVERFVGGGFAGQVYRVKLLELDAPDGPIGHLEVGGCYAVKILIPPSSAA